MTDRPAWSEQFTLTRLSRESVGAPYLDVSPMWAWAGSTGEGTRVAIVDSGIDNDHPAIDGRVVAWASFREGPQKRIQVNQEPHGDDFGHGTACADIIRRFSPEAELVSIKVLGANLRTKGPIFANALRWAIDQGVQVINLSLGTTRKELVGVFHDLADMAFFRRALIVTAANNMPVVSFPSLFASVISVACHGGSDPYEFYFNPTPPPEFGAPGIDLDVAWKGGGRLTVTGNSFAAPHISGLVSKILSKHPKLYPFEIKTILRSTAQNVG